MKRILKLTAFTLAAFLLALTLWHDTHPAHAQTITVPFSYSVGTGTHTACPAVVASTTQYCYPADGPWVSINGAAWQAIPLAVGAAGVTSVTVCNAVGASCGTPATGAVSLNIPKTATATAAAVTLN